MTETTWLPEGYKVPKTGGNYLKLEDGANRIRVLSAPVLGHEYWNQDNKPVRSEKPFEFIPSDAKLDEGQFKPKHFWAFIVWSYRENKVQLLEITQSTIQRSIEELVQSEDWGAPTGYDLTISRRGEKLLTEYTVQPSPHKPAPAEALEQYARLSPKLSALFSGDDPFGASDQSAVDTSVVSDEEAASYEAAASAETE